MDVNEAERIARALMDQHGLVDWTFAFDRACRRFGACWYKRRRITLSRPLTELNAAEEVRDTLLHEIAHALSPGGHTPAWKATCVRIGARPVRCFSPATVALPSLHRACTYVARCRCPQPHTRYRRPGRVYLCRRCRQKLVWRRTGLPQLAETLCAGPR